MDHPATSRSVLPTTPSRPYAISSATPPTTGGSTRGTVTSARSHGVARCVDRAKSHASGVPISAQMTRVEVVVSSERRSAGTTVGLARWAGMPAQSAFSSSATSGTSRTAIATHAGKTKPARAQRTDLMAVSYTHLRAHETDSYLVCRLLLEK